MKSQPSFQSAEKQPHIPLVTQLGTAASSSNPARRLRPSIDDLQERITTRAYELYVQRGRREGCALEDWVDAEREILSRNISSRVLAKPPRDMES
ncbi:MAG: DUF2934 domain-containing protein [Nitrospiraceae bacterium]|jgi:hypothetical protein|nr:DUF2934 domain-containing protein [Nitrospiraceae bacterium]